MVAKIKIKRKLMGAGVKRAVNSGLVSLTAFGICAVDDREVSA